MAYDISIVLPYSHSVDYSYNMAPLFMLSSITRMYTRCILRDLTTAANVRCTCNSVKRLQIYVTLQVMTS